MGYNHELLFELWGFNFNRELMTSKADFKMCENGLLFNIVVTIA
jgi:hypothetical protein